MFRQLICQLAAVCFDTQTRELDMQKIQLYELMHKRRWLTITADTQVARRSQVRDIMGKMGTGETHLFRLSTFSYQHAPFQCPTLITIRPCGVLVIHLFSVLIAVVKAVLLWS